MELGKVNTHGCCVLLSTVFVCAVVRVEYLDNSVCGIRKQLAES